MSTIVKADVSGALTLPAEFCREAGLEPHAELTAEIQDGMIILGPVLPPIWEQIVILTADAPVEELLKPPTDGASQHDHYLYGTPKRWSASILLRHLVRTINSIQNQSKTNTSLDRIRC